MLIVFNSTVLKAGIVDELNYVNEKSDFYFYISFDKLISFISARGIDVNEFDTMVMDNSTKESDKVIKEFGLKLNDINEFLMVMNIQDVEKKSG